MPDTTLARRLGLAALGVGLLAAPAFGQPAAPPRPAPAVQPPRPTVPDPAFDAAQAAYAALPEDARRGIQDALAWTGHSTSAVTGVFGRRTYDAILSYQRAAKAEPTGFLDPGARAALLAAGRRAREAVGFVVRRDPATGIALGVPGRLLPREGKAPQGTRWQSADGRVTLETRALDPAESDLQATFDRVSVATPDRKVTYRLKRPDFLVVTGETPTGRFYIRYAATPAGLRGFTLSYDKALAAEIDPVVIAVANSFDPMPSAAAAVAAATAPTSASPATEVRPARIATGLLVATGRLLTSAQAVAGCASPRVGRETARVAAADETAGLALLAFGGAAPVSAVPVAPAEADGDRVALGIDGTGAVTVVPGTASGGSRVLAPLQPGASGAPLFDAAGRLAGVVAGYPASPRLVAGLVPPLSHAVVPAARIAAFLARERVALATEPPADAPARSTGAVVSLFAGRVRQIACE